MILIAESGSTKTAWRLIKEDNTVLSFSLSGINPFHASKEQIAEEIQQSDLMRYRSDIKEVYFYGAGLATDTSKEIITTILREIFTGVRNIQVNDDLIAAANALFGKDKGIACILGTGSNTGLIANGELIEKVPALGYILGDEGSGANMGIRFINAYLKRDFSNELRSRLSVEPMLEMGDILDKVYKQKLPNKYLASLTKLIKKYEDEYEIKYFVKDCFQLFIDKNVKKYPNYMELPIGFVGSVAYHFKTLLLEVLEANDLQFSKIIQSPVDELVKYHNTITAN